MKLLYNNNKLVVPTPTCDCTYHSEVDCDIYIGEGIINNLSKYINNRIKGNKCLLVTDRNLYNLFKDKVVSILENNYNVTLSVIDSDGNLKPNQYAVGEIMMNLDGDTDFLVALGSGTVNDITRYVAYNCKLPFVSIGTSPSMDGYLSVVAPMLQGNLKINKPAKYPEVCVFDTDILKTSPLDMLFAGFGDVIGKYIAKADWILGNMINDEHICPFCLEVMDEAIKLCEENIDEIRNGSSLGVKSLLEALLLTGLAMLLNGDSRPAASNEHNMGHFIEMKKLQANQPHPSHGEAVGVATIYCLDVFKEFMSYKNSSFNIKNILDNRISNNEREKRILKAYGNDIGRSIIDSNTDEPISESEHKRRIETYLSKIDGIKESMEFLPSKEYILSLYKKLDGALNANMAGIEKPLLNQALLYAKDYRSRYNVFKLAEEMGILESIIDKVLDE